MVAAPEGFVVVLPVKAPALGKSRLVAPAGVDRRELAAAFAEDAVRSCLAATRVTRVLVVTEDARLADHVVRLGAAVCPDGPEPGLNPALRYGAAQAHARWPSLVPVALLADLPALRAADLDAALTDVADAVDGTTSYVVDADGTGTTLYAAAHDAFAPRFGPDSAAAHAAAGAVAIEGDLASLRRDVDDAEGLRAALALGVGPATRAVLSA
ncbi:MAG TPA: 2-phospho-L-lactate guanylyltransferase [Nocardioides sp.]|nr:2-phospho-L-lactate guanylyltransferase [Nocardioides sp.]